MPQITDGPVGQTGLIVRRPLTGGSFLTVWREALEGLAEPERRYFKGMVPHLELLSYAESQELLGSVAIRASVLGGVLLEALPQLTQPYPRPQRIVGVELNTTRNGSQYLYAHILPRLGRRVLSSAVADKAAIYRKCGQIDGVQQDEPSRPPAVLLASIGPRILEHGVAIRQLYERLDQHFQEDDGDGWIVEDGEFDATHTVPEAAVLPPR